MGAKIHTLALELGYDNISINNNDRTATVKKVEGEVELLIAGSFEEVIWNLTLVKYC